MKKVRILLMGVIGMMAFTVTATTTAKLEQKQKTELSGELMFQDYTATVVNNFQFVTPESTQVNSEIVQTIPIFKESKAFANIVHDVGWCSSGAKFTTIHYKEKLLENYDKDLVSPLNKRARNIS